jgi:hypothetical protein
MGGGDPALFTPLDTVSVMYSPPHLADKKCITNALVPPQTGTVCIPPQPHHIETTPPPSSIMGRNRRRKSAKQKARAEAEEFN